jgi:diacylglycerol kinase family enzyme
VALVVLTNPRSGANRRDPGARQRLVEAAGVTGRVLAPGSLEELDRVAAGLAASPPTAVAIHGGDGTLHKAVSALVRAFGARPLPPIAILPGGTMNVVAASLGLKTKPERFVAQLSRDLAEGLPFDTVRRRCLSVDGQNGFVFGAGFMANFLEEYYARPGYGAWRALVILLRTFASALVRGAYARRIIGHFAGRVRLDGQALDTRPLTGVGAAVVREVGLGFKLNHRADDDPERFGALAIFSGPLGLGLDLLAVHRGRGISPRRAASAVASRMTIELAHADDQLLYTIDGDLYRGRGALDVGLGPPIHFIRPR